MQTDRKKKVGIMGGTFNPIHNGHLLLAQNALEYYKLDKILFIPSGIPWQKAGQGVLDGNIRIEMTELAISDNSFFELSRIEVDRSGNSYTADTIIELKKNNPNIEYYFILGADSLLNLENWYHPEILLQECSLLAAVRDDCDTDKLKEQISYLTAKYHAKIYILPMHPIEISSSYIRKLYENGKSGRYLLPDSVHHFILTHGLYSAGN